MPWWLILQLKQICFTVPTALEAAVLSNDTIENDENSWIKIIPKPKHFLLVPRPIPGFLSNLVYKQTGLITEQNETSCMDVINSSSSNAAAYALSKTCHIATRTDCM